SLCWMCASCLAASTVSLPRVFILYSSCDHRDLQSFPTRRSSDLSISRSTRSSAACCPEHAADAYHGCIAAGAYRNEIARRRVRLDRKSTRSELQSRENLVCRLLLEKKKK